MELKGCWLKMENPIHFESGLSNITDLEGFIPTGLPIGIELHRSSKKVIDCVVDYINNGGKAFIDSGAFEAFRSGKAIDFGKTMDSYIKIMKSISNEMRSNLYIVAPDVLDDQIKTIQLQIEHSDCLREMIGQGVNVLTPIQRGPHKFTQVYHLLKKVLGTDNFSVSVPSNKVPWSWEELSEFVVRCKPKAIHFLGISSRRPKKYFRFEKLLRKVCGNDAVMTSDACSLRSSMRKGHDLMKVIDSEIEVKMSHFRDVNLEGDEGFIDHSEIDFTEYVCPLYNDPCFLDRMEAEVLGFSLGFMGTDLKQFIDDSQKETTLKYHRKMVDQGWFDFESGNDDSDRDEIHFQSRLGYLIQNSVYDPYASLCAFFSRYENYFRKYRKVKYAKRSRLDVRRNAISRHYSESNQNLVSVGKTQYDISPLLDLGYQTEVAVEYLKRCSGAKGRSKALMRLMDSKNDFKSWLSDLDSEEISWIKLVTGLDRNRALKLANHFDSVDDFYIYADRMKKAAS